MSHAHRRKAALNRQNAPILTVDESLEWLGAMSDDELKELAAEHLEIAFVDRAQFIEDFKKVFGVE